MDEKENTLYNMELYDQLEIEGWMYVLRVPGGWIYRFYGEQEMSTAFVPYSEEFKPVDVDVERRRKVIEDLL